MGVRGGDGGNEMWDVRCDAGDGRWEEIVVDRRERGGGSKK
jgi:hypothetical protein